MPDDVGGEKTEAPTPRRLLEARQKGQVAKSNDLTAAIGLLAALVLLNMYGPAIMKGFQEIMIGSLTLNNLPMGGAHAIDRTVQLLIGKSMLIVGPLMLILFAVALIANLLQVGFIFSGKPITPSFSKISPIQGVKRLLSLRTLMRMVINLFKVGIIGTVAYFSIRDDIPRMLGLTGVSYMEVLGQSAEMVFVLGLKLSLILLILGLADFGFQKWQLLKDLRMTKEEIKEEMKRMEGDPLMRQRRRAVARQLAMQRMSQAVPGADVVITNPPELALALKYDQDVMGAPKVVAKGSGFIAERIRTIANENGIPIVQRKPLAQTLYKACEVGDFIPEELYKAVAEVLAYVFELAGKGYRRASAAAV